MARADVVVAGERSCRAKGEETPVGAGLSGARSGNRSPVVEETARRVVIYSQPGDESRFSPAPGVEVVLARFRELGIAFGVKSRSFVSGQDLAVDEVDVGEVLALAYQALEAALSFCQVGAGFGFQRVEAAVCEQHLRAAGR